MASGGLLQQADVAAGTLAERAARFPLGGAVTLDDLTRAGREHVLDTLREKEPVTSTEPSHPMARDRDVNPRGVPGR